MGRVRVFDGWEEKRTLPCRREINEVSQRVSFGDRSWRSSIFFVKRGRGTVSKALLMSMVARVVLSGGCFLLKPSAMS